MAQTLVNFRMDEELKKNMESICQELGMSMNLKKVISEIESGEAELQEHELIEK